MKWLIPVLLILIAGGKVRATVDPIIGSMVCLGSEKRLVDSTPGGVWSSSNTSIATIGTTGRVTGVALGTAIITYTVDTEYVTAAITVNPLPSIYGVTGGGDRCAGGPGVPIGLSGSDAGCSYFLYGYTFTGGSIPSTLFLSTVTGVFSMGYFFTAGTYYVTAEDLSTGCTSNMTGSATIIINPNPSPITGPDTVCQGGTITMTDTTADGTWSSHSSSMASIIDSTGVLTGLIAGELYISYTVNGCSAIDAITVDSMAVPVISYDGGANTLYAPAGYTTYQWYDSLGLIPGATSASLAGLFNGYFYVVVTNATGCTGTSAYYNYNTSEMNASELSLSSKTVVYPSPASGSLIIASPLKMNSLVICDLIGSVVYQQVVNSTRLKIDVAGLTPGVYIIKTDNEVVGKFVKQ